MKLAGISTLIINPLSLKYTCAQFIFVEGRNIGYCYYIVQSIILIFFFNQAIMIFVDKLLSNWNRGNFEQVNMQGPTRLNALM